MKITFLLLNVALLLSASPSATAALSLFDGNTLDGWRQVPTNSWTVKDGVMASTGAGRGYIYIDPHEWSRVEILVNARDGTARMAVAQPIGSKAVEVLDFNDPTAGKEGPIAWQLHNRGLCDEYKEITLDPEPAEDDLITIK
jgi:hypothetical protein